MHTSYPWQTAQWQQIIRSWQQQRLAHAQLFAGHTGMGKAQFAQALAELVLCESPTADFQSCGQCKSCLLLQAGTHPDLTCVEPAEKGKQITIGQIRELIEFCSLTATYGRYQVAIINPAEAMNRNAANSLLKLLEEPPDNTLLILVSHQPMSLLATIRSRCQRLDFNHIDKAQAMSWLQQELCTEYDISLLLNLTHHAPLAVKTLIDNADIQKRGALFESLVQLPTGKYDPVSIAEEWLQQEPHQIVVWMSLWTMDLIRYSMTQQTQYIVNRDNVNAIQHIAQQFPPQQLFKLLDLQTEAYRLLNSTANIKPQGLLESLAIAWAELGMQRRKS
ncbi:DNA polymerase III subunit delta' [Candidatus Albibeggiatoa sp. nov. NOAA]|uniref:DNA polymerase III subunit delta' n=1 Tax=Candidatus Albibeggiatoa sp. nov. NOAA TaxID=3162724 RepID=UPI0033039EFA|nr:DNA polymerase III subunit delta' [Thiotrichaceae bacterium]